MTNDFLLCVIKHEAHSFRVECFDKNRAALCSLYMLIYDILHLI